MTFEEFWESYQSGESYRDDSELMDLLKTVAKHSWEAREGSALEITDCDAALTYAFVTFALEIMDSSGTKQYMCAKMQMDINSLLVRLSNYL